MKKKLRVALLFGGKSAEHEISLISARNIVAAMDKKKYEIVAIGIDKQGRWHSMKERGCYLAAKSRKSNSATAPECRGDHAGRHATPMVRRRRGGTR